MHLSLTNTWERRYVEEVHSETSSKENQPSSTGKSIRNSEINV